MAGMGRRRKVKTRRLPKWVSLGLAAWLVFGLPFFARGSDLFTPIPVTDWTYDALRALTRQGLLSDWERNIPSGERLLRFEAALLTQEALLRWLESEKDSIQAPGQQKMPPELVRLVDSYLEELKLLGWQVVPKSQPGFVKLQFQDLDAVTASSLGGKNLVVGGVGLQRHSGTSADEYTCLVTGSALVNGWILVNAARAEQLLRVGGNWGESSFQPTGESTTSFGGEFAVGENLRLSGGTTYSSAAGGVTAGQRVGAALKVQGIEVGAEIRATQNASAKTKQAETGTVGGGLTLKIGNVSVRTGVDLISAPSRSHTGGEGSSLSFEETAVEDHQGTQATAGITVQFTERNSLEANLSIMREKQGSQQRSVTAVGVGYRLDSARFLLGYQLLHLLDGEEDQPSQSAMVELKLEF